MSHPFEPTTTEKLKAVLKEYLEENSQSPDINKYSEKAFDLKNGNKLILLRRILKTWGQRQINS